MAQALNGGVDAVLLREKSLDSARLLALASELRQLSREFDARLIVHTQADVALAVGADGVHLCSADIGSIPALRQWTGDIALSVSVSCHNAEELRKAWHLGADWATLSPVFPTLSHPGAPALGVAAFRQLVSHCSMPVVALGGIDADSARELTGTPLAVMRAILDARDPGQAAAALAAIARA